MPQIPTFLLQASTLGVLRGLVRRLGITLQVGELVPASRRNPWIPGFRV